jgi:predicted esterase
MLARYTVDPARIVLHGFSEGGQFAYHLAFKYRELFRGLVPVAAPLQERPPDNDPDFRLQYYLLCGTLDERYRLVQGTAEGLRSLKYPVVLSPVEGLDAKYPPDERLRQIGKWIDSLDRI